MSFFKKIFSSNKPKEKTQKAKQQKTSFLTWLCASKSSNLQHKDYQNNHLNGIPLQSSAKKNTNSFAQTKSTKIVQRLSFGNKNYNQFIEEQLKSTLVSIQEQVIESVEDLIEEDGFYGMVGGDQPLSNRDDKNNIWIKIGKGEQINSLSHIRPYFFTNIFIFMDELGFEFSISQILYSRQTIFLKLYERSSTQQIIDSYEKQLIENYGFKPLSQCFSKLKLTVYKTRNTNSIWIHFNKLTPIQSYVEDILGQIGFFQQNEQYLKLKEEIPNLLTLQEYMEFTENKNKLMSKYQGENVDQYIKNKFLQKINSKSHTPRNTDSPRTLQKNVSNQGEKSQSSGYNEYILSMTANTLPLQRINEAAPINKIVTKIPEKNSYEEEIFEFNIYKEEKEQEAKRVAISKQRKKRSRSEDITVGDLHNCDDLEGQSDYFDKRD